MTRLRVTLNPRRLWQLTTKPHLLPSTNRSRSMQACRKRHRVAAVNTTLESRIASFRNYGTLSACQERGYGQRAVIQKRQLAASSHERLFLGLYALATTFDANREALSGLHLMAALKANGRFRRNNKLQFGALATMATRITTLHFDLSSLVAA